MKTDRLQLTIYEKKVAQRRTQKRRDEQGVEKWRANFQLEKEKLSHFLNAEPVWMYKRKMSRKIATHFI